MKWTDVRDGYPEEGLEVVCVVTKFGNRVQEPFNKGSHTDKDGRVWHKISLPLQYELLWRNGDKWENWKTENFENNPDYKYVIAWADVLDYKLNEV